MNQLKPKELPHICRDIDDAVGCELLNMLPSDVNVYQHLANQAWVSTGKYGKSDKDVKRVVRTCTRLGHNQVLESIVFNFKLKMPVFVASQWRTHRTQSVVQASARYGNISYVCWRSEDEHENEIINNLLAYKQSKGKVKQDDVRSTLPQGMITEMCVTINLWSLMNMLQKRSDAAADPVYRMLMRRVVECLPQDVIDIIEYRNDTCIVNKGDLLCQMS